MENSLIFTDITHVYYILGVYYSCSFKFSLDIGSISIRDQLRAETFFSTLFVVIRCIRTPGVLYEEKIISFLSLSRRQEFAMPVFDPKVLIYSKQG